jgi:hypothetical protein
VLVIAAKIYQQYFQPLFTDTHGYRRQTRGHLRVASVGVGSFVYDGKGSLICNQ